jgi:hypothetical protein
MIIHFHDYELSIVIGALKNYLTKCKNYAQFHTDHPDPRVPDGADWWRDRAERTEALLKRLEQ